MKVNKSEMDTNVQFQFQFKICLFVQLALLTKIIVKIHAKYYLIPVFLSRRGQISRLLKYFHKMLTLYFGFYFVLSITLPLFGQIQNVRTVSKSEFSWYFENVQNVDF